MSGAAWSIVGQVTPMIITIFLTPYILHGLGVVRYGLFVLTGTLVGFLGTFDGGVRATAQRQFSIFAGRDDVKSTTALMTTLLLLISTFGICLSVAGWFVAPVLASIFGIHGTNRAESVYLFRTLGILVMFAFAHNLFVAVLQARGKYSYITKAGFAVYALWAIGLVLTIHFHWGLRGIAWVYISQQIFLILVVMPASFRYMRREFVSIMPRSETKEFMKFGGRVQISNLATLINTEFDTLIIGAGVSVRYVSYYNAGANFALNIATIPLVAVPPVQTLLANTYGRDGEDRALVEFARVQRIWIIGLSGWFTVAGAAAYFGVTSWLGQSFAVGGVIAVVALATQFLVLSTAILRTYCTVVGRPGLESRYGALSVVVNIVLTIPLLLTGAIGVAAATAFGQLVGTSYLDRAARAELSGVIPHVFRGIPPLRCGVTAIFVVAVELAARPIVPTGGLGLLAATIPAGAGLVLYAVLILGPRRAWRVSKAAPTAIRSGTPTTAARLLLNEAMS